MTDPDVYDFAPLLREGRVVGRVARKRLTAGSSEAVGALGEPLDDRMVVSADATLRELVLALASNPFLFVVTGAELTGLVTTSDLNREAARAYFFLLIVGFEMALALVTRTKSKSGEANLREALTAERWRVIQRRLRLQRSFGAEIDEVACMDLRDLIDICLRLMPNILSESLMPSWKALAVKTDHDEYAVVRLRHDTAHATKWSSLVGRRSLGELRALEDALRNVLLFFESPSQI
jgi:hypothetical protein